MQPSKLDGGGAPATDREKYPRRTLMIALAIVAVVASAAAMFWIWRSGGAPLGARIAKQTAVEECGARLSGSSVMGLELAPAVVGDFLRHSGYEVGGPQTLSDGLIQIEGRRGQVRCTVTIRALESTTGFDDLASGAALIALSSRHILSRDKEVLRRVKAGDFEADRALAEHVVAYNAIAVIVNRANPIERLDTDQVADIYTGIHVNWRVVHGANSAIEQYAALELSGGDDYPSDLVPSEEEIWANAAKLPNMHVVRDDRDVLAAVMREPLAVGYVSGSSLRGSPNVRVLPISAGSTYAPPTVSAMQTQAYPLTHRLFLYVRPRDMRENAFVRSFVGYFKSADAYNRIEQMGFAALRESAAQDASAIAAMGCFVGAPETATIASALRGAERSGVILRFRPNTRDLDDAATADIARLVPDLMDKVTKGWHVMLVGHSDATGDLAKNRQLALNRALTARSAFEARGVFGLQVESAGENCPIADMDSAEGHRLNRRVEIWFRAPAQQTRATAGP